MENEVPLPKLSHDDIDYFYNEQKGNFIMHNIRTGKNEYIDTLLPDQLEIFMTEYSDLLSTKPQNTRTNSFFAHDDNILPLPEVKDPFDSEKLFSFDKSDKKYVIKSKQSQNKVNRLHANQYKQISDSHKIEIGSVFQTDLPKPTHSKPDALDFQNDDSMTFTKPPLQKSAKSLKRFPSRRTNSKDNSSFDNSEREFDFANIKGENTDKQSSPLIQQTILDLKKQGGTTVQKLNSTGHNSTDSTDKKPKWCQKFSMIFSVTFFFMVVVWIFNLGYSYGKYFTQIKPLSPRLVQFYYIYSAICMFITIVLMGGSIFPLPSHWYLIFALFGIGHIVTSTVVLSIVVPKMDKDPSLQVLKNNVKAHVGLDIINGILMVIGALGSHYCRYQCILKQDLLANR